MSIYRLQVFDDAGRRPPPGLAECADDGAAVREALRTLAGQMACTGCDVFEGERLIARVMRPAPAPGLRPAIHGAG